jgi:aminomethyltransferase
MPEQLRRSPLHPRHEAAGAKLVAFGGWEMPLSYPTGTVAEHLACRRAAACFDVSHLGTVVVQGPGAFDQLQRALTNDLRRIRPGRTQYTHLLADDGSVVDDLIVWWVADDVFHVMPNASNTAAVLAATGGEDVTSERAVIAVQGPQARQVLTALAPEAAQVGRSTVREVDVAGHRVLVAGTGYTGEDGVELAVPADGAAGLWDALVRAGATPAGLGARDTLRLEAGLPLHGHELGPGISPLQAGLGWVVAWDKPEAFPGRAALAEERRRGPRRRLRGLVGTGRRPLRNGAPVLVQGRTVGRCTSGSFSPMLGRGIALALVDAGPDAADEQLGLPDGAAVEVVIGGGEVAATVVTPPFVPVGR